MSWQEILGRARHGASVTGIPLEVYLAHVAAGEAYCSGHRDFHPLAEFGTRKIKGVEYRRTWCRVWHAREAEPRWHAAKRHAAKRSGHTGACLGPVPEAGCYVRWGRLPHRHCACGEPMGINEGACRRCRQERPWAA